MRSGTSSDTSAASSSEPAPGEGCGRLGSSCDSLQIARPAPRTHGDEVAGHWLHLRVRARLRLDGEEDADVAVMGGASGLAPAMIATRSLPAPQSDIAAHACAAMRAEGRAAARLRQRGTESHSHHRVRRALNHGPREVEALEEGDGSGCDAPIKVQRGADAQERLLPISQQARLLRQR